MLGSQTISTFHQNVSQTSLTGLFLRKVSQDILCEVNKKKIEDVDDKKAKTSLRKLSLFEFRDFFSEKIVESKCRCLAATPSIVDRVGAGRHEKNLGENIE